VFDDSLKRPETSAKLPSTGREDLGLERGELVSGQKWSGASAWLPPAGRGNLGLERGGPFSSQKAVSKASLLLNCR